MEETEVYVQPEFWTEEVMENAVRLRLRDMRREREKTRRIIEEAERRYPDRDWWAMARGEWEKTSPTTAP